MTFEEKKDNLHFVITAITMIGLISITNDGVIPSAWYLSLPLFCVMGTIGNIGSRIGSTIGELIEPDRIPYTTLGEYLKERLFWAIGPMVIGSTIGMLLVLMVYKWLFG